MLQNLINNIETGSDSDKLKWLFDAGTMGAGSKLSDRELKLLEAELRDNGYKAMDIRSYIKQVKAIKKQQNELSHIDIAVLFIDGGKKYKQEPAKNRIMFARSSWHVYENGVWVQCEDYIIERELQFLLKRLENKHGLKFTNAAQKSILAFIQQRLTIADDMLDNNE